jgi:prepilin-type N-terminal cleavage/methylation domain-containing protein
MEQNILKPVRQRGFTLLELLIVIAIIGILISVGVASYAQAQKKARNSKRRSDMQAIQAGFEQYYADNNGSYPANCSADMSLYLPAGFPADPKSTSSYTQSCSAGQYCFCASLEGETGNASGTDCAAFVAGPYFCVKNLQ